MAEHSADDLEQFMEEVRQRNPGESEFHPGARPWGVKCDLAFPCATRNELELGDARQLLESGCVGVSEGANMPTTLRGEDPARSLQGSERGRRGRQHRRLHQGRRRDARLRSDVSPSRGVPDRREGMI
jgi:hypothetical protein